MVYYHRQKVDGSHGRLDSSFLKNLHHTSLQPVVGSHDFRPLLLDISQDFHGIVLHMWRRNQVDNMLFHFSLFHQSVLNNFQHLCMTQLQLTSLSQT